MNDTKYKTLDVELLNIHKGEYLSEALKRQGYPMLPSNAIINKVMTGTGATYMELNAKLSPRNSIVIEPYRSAVENKVQAFDEAQGVFKEVTVKWPNLGRLLLFIYLENQRNDADDQDTELKQVGISDHDITPLRCSGGGTKKSGLLPKKGPPAYRILAAPAHIHIHAPRIL